MSNAVFSFMEQARQISKNQVIVNRDKVAKADLVGKSMEQAVSLLGKDVGFLNEDSEIRLFIRDTFGRPGLEIFSDPHGTIDLNAERAFLLYSLETAKGSDLQKAARGLLYFMTSRQLSYELARLVKAAGRDQWKPEFTQNVQYFNCKTAPGGLRGYMKTLLEVPGYTRYTYSRADMISLAFLLETGMEYEAANKRLKNKLRGLLFSHLNGEFENPILRYALSEELPGALMDGDYAEDYLYLCGELTQNVILSKANNPYMVRVKPRMITMLGTIIEGMQENMQQTGYSLGDALRFYHLTPDTLGIAIRDDLSIKDVIPEFAHHFKPAADKVSMDEVMRGNFL